MNQTSTTDNEIKLMAAYSEIRPSEYKDLRIVTDSPEERLAHYKDWASRQPEMEFFQQKGKFRETKTES